jgi:phosphoribosyl-ATP pyrophosphohydrolase/phosphoribosyl-AMP cyclohydrolase
MTERADAPGLVIAALSDLDRLDFAKGGGVVTVVAQDADDGRVLMVAQADREALERTLSSGQMWYRSRSRGLWHKGATSGNVQQVVALRADCDGDAVLAQVRSAGPACHTGEVSCFGAYAAEQFGRLDAVVAARAAELGAAAGVGSAAGGSASSGGASGGAKPSYTAKLLGDRNLRLKKLGEEAVELATACVDGDAERAAEEAADILYHSVVALRALGVGVSEVRGVLRQREG